MRRLELLKSRPQATMAKHQMNDEENIERSQKSLNCVGELLRLPHVPRNIRQGLGGGLTYDKHSSMQVRQAAPPLFSKLEMTALKPVRDC